jgi:lipopolysaccharide transport system permease protein
VRNTSVTDKETETIMWEYRELIRNLTVAELKNRYQNTSLGFLWSLLSPLCMAMVLWFVFKRLFQQEQNFAINLMVGIMMWRYFSTVTIACMNSILTKPNLVTKVYIPRHLLVFSSALSGMIGSLLEFLVLIPIIYIMLGHLPWTIVFYPLVHILFLVALYGLGLILSSFFVYFRDLGQIWDVAISILIYCSPIIYPLSVVPNYLINYYMINPITQFVMIYRDVMINGRFPTLISLVITVVFAAAMFIIGNLVFSKLQRRFAEEL